MPGDCGINSVTVPLVRAPNRACFATPLSRQSRQDRAGVRSSGRSESPTGGSARHALGCPSRQLTVGSGSFSASDGSAWLDGGAGLRKLSDEEAGRPRVVARERP